MQRRTFLKMAGTGAAVVGSGSLLTACGSGSDSEMAAVAQRPLGIQLYTMRNLLGSGVGQVLSDVAAIGYKEIELFGLGMPEMVDNPLFGLSATEFRAVLDDAGLSAPIAHINGNAMNISELADLAHEVGIQHLVVAMAPEFISFENGEFKMVGITGRDQVDRIAERLNRQGELARAAGIGFGYHNHHMEFEPLDDGNAFDYLFAQADANLVKMELDIGWTMVAGYDPIDVLERYGSRVIAVHVKDYDPSRTVDDPSFFTAPIQAQIVEPGSGPTDFVPILATLDDIGVNHRFVEIDATPEPLAAITRGYDYLIGLRE